VDERGAPVAGAPVVALIKRTTNGIDGLDTATPVSKPYIEGTDYRMPNVVRASTDALGRYRLEDMAPGDYYISAQKPVAVDREINARMSAMASGNFAGAFGLRRCGPPLASSFGGARPADSAIGAGTNQASANSATETDVQLFYPGTTDAGRATAVHAPAGGDVVGIDFVLQPQRLGQVHVSIVRPTGSATRESGSQGSATIALVAAGLRFISQQPSVACADERDGKAEIRGVVPGPYKLIAVTSQTDFKTVGIRDVYVESGGDVSVTLPLKRGIDVSGQLRLDSLPRGFNPATVTIRLMPADSESLIRVSLANSSVSTSFKADGSFVLHDVIPGLPYKLSYSFGSNSPGVLPSALYDGKQVKETLTVENEAARLDLFFESKREIN
jgi:hypothetical protein